MTAKSQFSNYPNPTNQYFDPEQEFLALLNTYGCSPKFINTLRVFGAIINQAYFDGFEDGQKEARGE